MMLDAIRSFMNRKVAPQVRVEPGRPAPEGVRVAACALLLELAHADGEFSAEEQAHIESAVARHFGLDDETTQELLALANAKRAESIDHFSFTRVINRDFDLGQKVVLAEVMWGVILADGQIGDHEAYLVRKIGNLLDLPPAYLADARRAAQG
jgi:uncharacterized tellurite resistance protein B-like protein